MVCVSKVTHIMYDAAARIFYSPLSAPHTLAWSEALGE